MTRIVSLISLRARLVRMMSKQFFRRVDKDSDIPPLRKFWSDIAGRARLAPGVRVRETTIAGVDCEWLVPDGADKQRVLLYLHGGAYVMGSPATHRRMVSFICAFCGIPAMLPDYRLAPEHPFPAGLDDCLAVYREVREGQLSGSRIAIGGDSAGGGMTVATLMSLRDAGDPLPTAAVLLSPWLDLTASGESATTRAARDPWFDPADMPAVAEHYCEAGQTSNPLVSPVYGDAGNLPPTLIQVGDDEILLSDSTRFAEQVTAEGGQAELQVWPGMWHVFQYFVGQMPESRKALKRIAHFLTTTLN